MKRHDVVGIVLAVPMFLIGLGTLPGVVWPPDNIAYTRLFVLMPGIPCLLISVGLFLPGSRYEQKVIRRFGFVALGLATALTVFCAFWSCYITVLFLSYPHDEWSLMGPFLGGGCLAACLFALSCTFVLSFKLQPRPARAGIWVAAGSAVSLVPGGMTLGLVGLLCALLRPHDLGYGNHAHKVISCSAPFLGAGFLVGAILGAALGAWLVRRAVEQRGSFWKALLGAGVGSVMPLIGTVAGAVIGSRWGTRPTDTTDARN